LATKFYKFYGDAKWAKFQVPDEKYDQFAVDLFLDQKSMDLFKKSGLQLKVKNLDGADFVSFRRPRQKLIKGALEDFGPPTVVDALGRPFAELVGNGSKIAVEVAVYDTQKGKGHRMEKVHILEHVPYNGGVVDAHEDGDDEPAVEAPKAAKKGLVDDNIPF
jgi:hypothetical protein